jgi:peptidoglycan hydrolase CwlO-like protein
MIKKIAFSTLAVAAVGGMVFGTDVFSYARTGYNTARDKIRSEVPIEFEIERAKQEVEQLLPEVRKSMHVIAEGQVEIEQLRKSIERKEKSLEEQEEAILSLNEDLKSGDTKFVYANRRYTVSEVEKDLAERFNRFKIAEETVKREKELLAAKEQAISAHRETLEGMLSQKKNLEAELERLNARVKALAARKQINSLEINDSQLNRAKSLIATIEKRLDVEDAVLAAEGDFNGLIPVETKRVEQDVDVARQIEDYFGKGRDVRVVQQ